MLHFMFEIPVKKCILFAIILQKIVNTMLEIVIRKLIDYDIEL